MNAPELVAAIGGGRLGAVTVFFGDETWFASEGVRAARAAFLPEGDAEGYLVFDAPRNANDREGTGLGDALDEGRTVPMFGGRKLVVWRGRTVDDEGLAALVSVAESSPAFCRFVIVISSLGKAAAKKLEKAGVAVAECRRLFDTPWPGNPEFKTALNQWTAQRARAHGLGIPLPVAHVLTGAIGNDLGAVDSALVKLSLNLPQGTTVTEDDLAPLLGGGRDYGSFAFGEALYSRDAAKAFRVARNAFREGMEDASGRRSRSPDQVAARLLWSAGYQLEKVWEAARMLGDGKRPAEAVLALGRGRKTPMATRAVRYAEQFRREELVHHHVLLEAAEAETRTSVPKEVVIETLIPRIAGAADG